MDRYITELEGEGNCGWDFDEVGEIFEVRMGYDVLPKEIREVDTIHLRSWIT